MKKDLWEDFKNRLRQRAKKHKWYDGFDMATWVLLYAELIEKLPIEKVKKMHEVQKRATRWERLWHWDKVFQRSLDAVKKK